MKFIRELLGFYLIATLYLVLEMFFNKGYITNIKVFYLIMTICFALFYIGRGIYYLIKKKKIKKLLKIQKNN